MSFFATSPTTHPTYSLVKKDAYIAERFNSGEQPNGLNLIIQDEKILSYGGSNSALIGPSILNRQSPSGSGDMFLFSGTTLVLTPR